MARKGESYRKGKLKEVKRVGCPKWTISETTLHELSKAAGTMGICQSRIVESAINKLLKEHPNENNKILITDKLFT